MALRVMWPSHCQERSGWVVGWAQDDCICVATVIPENLLPSCRALLRGESSLPLEEVPRPSRSASQDSCSSLEDQNEPHKERPLCKFIGIDRLRADARPPSSRPSVRGSLPSVSSPTAGPCSSPAARDRTGCDFSGISSAVLPDLQEKVRLLNLKFSRDHWGAKLQVLGYYDLSNLLITNWFLFVFGAAQRKLGSRCRPKILYYGNRPAQIPPHQVILYTQPRVHQFYPEPFEWQKVCLVSRHRADLQKKFSHKCPVDEQKYLNSLHQINASQRVEWLLGPDSPLSQEPSEKMADKALHLMASRRRSALWYLARTHVLFISFFFWLMRIVQYVLDCQLPLVGKLANVGVLGPCITSRIDLWFYIRQQWTELDRLESYWKNDISTQYHWIRVYDAILAIFIDWILGLVVNFLIFNYIIAGDLDFMSAISKTLITWVHEWLKRKVQWITAGSPGGIKLNVYVASSFGSLIFFYIDRWLVTACAVSNLIPYVFLLISYSGACGLSTLIAMTYDSLYFLNMQVHWMYKGTTKIYRLQLIMLRSLWLLFRGKKRNVLRDRINLCDYSLDQLILGIFLFITTFYLISTCLIFYLLFVYVILLVLLLRIVSLVVITTLNHFPYYQLALCLSSKNSLLSGVYLRPLDSAVVTKERSQRPHSCRPTKLQIRYDLQKDEDIFYYELKYTHTKFWHLFSHLRSKIQSVFLRYNVKHMLNLIALGHPLG